MEKTDPQFKLRLPLDLKTRLERSAENSTRSVTAEIVHRLELSFAAGRASDELIKSHLLNFQLAAELTKHDPAMSEVVNRFLYLLFGRDGATKSRVYEMMAEGDEIAARAFHVMRDDLGSILEEAAKQVAAEPKKAKPKR